MEHSKEKMQESCPICQSKTLVHAFHVKDHFLSQEEFDLFRCKTCDVIVTLPVPEPDKLESYYESREYFSHGGNKKGLVPASYNFIKGINIKKKYLQSTKGLELGEVLDIGCGIGDFLAYSKTKGWKVSGLEPNKHARQIVKQQHKIEVEDVSQISKLPDESFSLVTLFHVLEHVIDPLEMIREIHRILKPEGRLVIALPNNESWDAKFYKEVWAGWDVPRHLFHFNPRSISNLMSRFPFQSELNKPMIWDAYYVSLLSEKYKKKSFPIVRAAFMGFISNCKAKRKENYSSVMYFYKKPV